MPQTRQPCKKHDFLRQGDNSVVLPGNATEKWPEPFAQIRCDKTAAFLDAEDTMEIGTDVGHEVYSAVPAGLWQCQTVPGVETPGYFLVPSGQQSPQNLSQQGVINIR